MTPWAVANIGENGAEPTPLLAWSGGPGGDCSGWTSTSATEDAKIVDMNVSGWFGQFSTCAEQWHLFCIDQDS